MSNDFTSRIARELAQAERVSDATLAEIERELQREPTADLWILLGDAIQLGDSAKYSLADAEASYRRALDLKPLSAEAYESLAFFTFAVKTDAQASVPLFQRAIKLGAGESARDGLQAAVNDLAESDPEFM